MVSGCSDGRIPEDSDKVSDPLERDYFIRFEYNGLVKKMCVLAYAAEGSGKLRLWREIDGSAVGEGLGFPGPEEGLVVAAVANSPRKLNIDALQFYESLEYLISDLAEDSPDAPVMSGVCYACPGVPAVLVLSPLMCSVTLDMVDNLSGTLMEHPRIYLSDVSSTAETFRFNGFRLPSESASCSDTLWLDTDIGVRAARPHLTLHCYPNDPDPPSFTCPATGIVLECRMAGEPCSFRKDIYPLGRGERVNLSLEIRNSADYDWNVFRN